MNNKKDRSKLLDFKVEEGGKKIDEKDIVQEALERSARQLQQVGPSAQNILFSLVRGRGNLLVNEDDLDQVIAMASRLHEKLLDAAEAWAKKYDAEIRAKYANSGLVIPGAGAFADHIPGGLPKLET